MSDKKHPGKKIGLAQLSPRTLLRQDPLFSVGMLEKKLLKRFPASDGAEGDRIGLLVGDPASTVAHVAVALDPTPAAIGEAQALGANVLVTHHPAYRLAPGTFHRAESVALSPGAGVYAAIREGVALMCFHTALDVSHEAARILPGMLGLDLKGIVDPLEGDVRKGYGQLCAIRSADRPLTLGQLAARCTAVFGRLPRVWGDFNKPLTKVATCTGSAGDLSALCLSRSLDCLVCGEIRYHDALAVKDAGLGIIELGHDTSELPLVAVLAAAVESVGFPEDRVVIIDQKDNWTYPEAVRI
ncbi:MAG: Nif3-like dinuclear metal center hexameric protein [Coriobacteriaceae bacterium]|nr:Nif3-like dinuclear metal center hexameric protein [Coriobacteriaceae bacterium]